MMVHTVVRLCTDSGRFSASSASFTSLTQCSNLSPTFAYTCSASGVVTQRRNSFMAPMVSGCAANVPMT